MAEVKKRKWRTGFCDVGFHEGTRTKDAAGVPAKVCEFIDTCNCECHVRFDKMHEATGVPRVPHGNPDYRRPERRYWMPDPYAPTQVEGETEAEKIAARSPLEARVKSFDPTPTGKRARGQLEAQVLEICTQFTKGLIEEDELTPNVIAFMIDEVEPPSVGAIGAVFDRWAKLGFANCEKGPVRFTSFTVDGMKYGLDYMKTRAKKQGKLAQQAAGRVLRPKKPRK